MEVSLTQMLLARDRRAARQQALLEQYQCPVLSYTMNIAGPCKHTAAIGRGFDLGLRDVERLIAVERISCLHRECIREDTGCEALLVLDTDPRRLKDLTTQLEEASPLGRLLDLDVLDRDGQKLSRPKPRRCLLCGQMAQVCARSRAHSVADLQSATDAILQAAILSDDANRAAQLAQQALLYEAAATPKPGLVDRADSGSHGDMDYFTFLRSVPALGPYFVQCVQIGRRTATLPPEETFARLRLPGRLAEGQMLEATGGVNTHKGAIFSLGLVCGALGRLNRTQWSAPDRVLDLCAAMTASVLEDFHLPGDTAGKQLYRTRGITGIRGEAAAGYPAVRQTALPTLHAALAAGHCINDAACAALIALMAQNQDTNLLHRGGPQGQEKAARAAAELLRREPFPCRQSLEALNRTMIADNLSPGGCADLLAMALMMLFLEEDTPPAP